MSRSDYLFLFIFWPPIRVIECQRLRTQCSHSPSCSLSSLTVLSTDRSLSNRGVTVHKYDGSVRTLVLTSRFGMISVQQGEKLNFFFFYSGLLNKLLFL